MSMYMDLSIYVSAYVYVYMWVMQEKKKCHVFTDKYIKNIYVHM